MIMDSNSNENFSAYTLITKKRDGHKLTKNEIKWFIDGFTAGDIPDYQMASFLMAIYLMDMDAAETAALTDAMLYSGDVLDFNDQTVIDKHSTGGVGDKTSFILAPIAAAVGVKVPMIAGRGLGHTGGTVDKIESIENFNTSLSMSDFKRLLYESGIVLIGQTGEIAPADKKIYALRDVTATIESIPLITGSIMSKKLAEGTSGIVMDIKCGSGAFMKTKTRARALAKSLSNTALRFNKNMITMITDMSQPLGFAVGNSLEIIECVETLKGNGPKDLTKLCLELAGGMIYLAGLAKTHDIGIKKAKATLKDGTALSKFRELIKTHGGDPAYVDDYSHFNVATKKTQIISDNDGHVHSIDGVKIGLQCVELGGGRKKAEDNIDFAVGFIIHKKIGDRVKKGEAIATIHHHKHQQPIADKMIKIFNNDIYKIKKGKPKKLPELIYETKINWSK